MPSQDEQVKLIQIARLEAEARGFGLQVAEKDGGRPWGGFLRFTQDSLANFKAAYWPDVTIQLPAADISVDPKVLLVAPGAMLSLQWHRRRTEKWRVIDGPVRVVTGNGWDTLASRDYQAGEILDLGPQMWHRLIGLGTWGRVSEFWQHTDPANPSVESDVLRVQDIYKRCDADADASPLEQRDELWAKFYDKR